MLKTLKELLIVSLIAVVGVAAVSPAASAQTKDDVCKGVEAAGGQCSDSGQVNDLIANVVNVLSAIVGIVAVIMIIYAGFKYITAGGDAGSISSAKSTLIYAIVGLVIAAMAQIITGFVLEKTPT
jgi:hypothetical protein